MLRRVAPVALLLAGAVCPCAGAAAQEAHHLSLSADVLPAATPQCSGGVVYDDGVFNDAYSIGNGDPGDATMVMKLDLPAGTTTLDQACVCFTRTAAGPTTMSFQIVVYNDNGGGGQPGTLLGTIPATATSIPLFGTTQFYSVNLAGSGLVLPDTSVYVGARWPGGDILMCGDRSTTTAQRTSFGSGNLGTTWTNLTTLFSTAPPRAMGIRVDPHPAAADCTPSATAMCLNDNRFRVAATFLTPGGLSGDAHAVELTDDTGYLWFFSATNVEVVVKVLNACTLNNRYWVFAGGLTNVRTVITVTDTKTGTPKTYINPQNTSFQPIQDTSAFATCP